MAATGINQPQACALLRLTNSADSQGRIQTYVFVSTFHFQVSVLTFRFTHRSRIKVKRVENKRVMQVYARSGASKEPP